MGNSHGFFTTAVPAAPLLYGSRGPSSSSGGSNSNCGSSPYPETCSCRGWLLWQMLILSSHL